MIQMQTNLDVADNSGGRSVRGIGQYLFDDDISGGGGAGRIGVHGV